MDGYAIPFQQRRTSTDNDDRVENIYSVFLYMILLCATGLLVLHMLPSIVTATQDRALTDLFRTQAFSGSWKVFEKINWVGAILSTLISAFCFLGLFGTALRLTLSLLYLSNKNLFDTIDEIKSKGKGQKGFGMLAIGKEVFNANYGTGLDAFVAFFLSLFPNVKNYSDYATGRVSYNLSEDDTCTTFILKISLPTIMTIFFFSIGFNGVLWQAFGNVVNAMGVASQRLVDEELSTYVDRALNTGSNYTFTYDGDNTKFGSFRQKLSKTVYSKVLREVTDLNSDNKIAIGAAIDKQINDNFTAKNIDSSTGSTVQKADDDASNLEYSVVINNTEKYDQQSKCYYKVLSFDDLGIVNSADKNSKKYVHIFVTKKANSTKVEYFVPKDTTTKNSSNSNKPDDQIQKGVQ